MIDRSLMRLDGMKKLIFDLLDLTRIESGQKRARHQARGRARARQGAIELFTVDAERRASPWSCEDGPASSCCADPGELEIIFNNLVSNAVKYNRDGGNVTVSSSRTATAR